MDPCIVSSADFLHYDNWSPLFHIMLAAARARSWTREEYFWKYITDQAGKKRYEIENLFQTAGDMDDFFTKVEAILLPRGHSTYPQKHFTPEDREVIKAMLHECVSVYVRNLNADLDKRKAELQRIVMKIL